ncbi:MAG TPA: hypothetical protein VMW27_18335 [Thermoanaerobaculia bacterium]|nr:hypothetical protein [Thermoanaerobaculia bacterium]
MRKQTKWILALAVVLLGGAALPAAAQECARMTDGHRSLVQLFEAAPEGPACREPGPLNLAEVKPGDEEPVPADGICNCDKDEDCKAICGDKGGYCGIFLACPIPPYKHVGSCFCKQ